MPASTRRSPTTIRTPLFKEDELRDPRLIAPREFKSFAEAKAANLPKGEPVKIKGELYHVDTK
jgi:hypothetical protein